jgi:hypothetical protein
LVLVARDYQGIALAAPWASARATARMRVNSSSGSVAQGMGLKSMTVVSSGTAMPTLSKIILS